MSRYVEVEVAASLAELRGALAALGLSAQSRADGRRISLEGSLECSAQPVDLRFDAGVMGAVEDFGFVVEGERLSLVCGDVDEGQLRAELLAPLSAHLIEARIQALASSENLEGQRLVEADGTTRIVVRRK